MLSHYGFSAVALAFGSGPPVAGFGSTRYICLSPYSVIYSQDGNELLVLAIAHQHRKPGYWRDRLQTR